MISSRRTAAIAGLVIASPFALLVACGSSSNGAGANGDGGTTTAADVTLDAGVGPAKGPVTACKPDESAPVPTDRCTTNPADKTLPQCGVWTKVEIDGTVCGDGSPYKFFVNYSNTSNDVMVNFEPGGASTSDFGMPYVSLD